MQANADLALPPVRRNDLPGPQQTPCRKQPDPTSQSGYYSVQQRTLNQRNAPDAQGSSNGHSFSSASRPHASSASLQLSPVGMNDLPGTQQTLNCSPTSQSGRYGLQQRSLPPWNAPRSLGSSNGHSFNSSSQPNSNSNCRNVALKGREPGLTSQTVYYTMQPNQLSQWSNLQSRGSSNGHTFNSISQPNSGFANLQAQFTGQHQLLYITPASNSASCPNVTAPLNDPTANLSHHAKLQPKVNTLQDYVNGTSAWVPSGTSNASSVLEKTLVNGAAPPRYKPLSEQNNRMQTLHQRVDQPPKTSPNVPVSQTAPRTDGIQNRNGASYVWAGEPPPAQQATVARPLPPPYRHANSQRQSQRGINPAYSVVHQNHLNHRVPTEQLGNPRSASLPQHAIRYNLTSLPVFPANPCNTETKGIQSNSTSGVLTRASEDASSSTSPTNEAPSPDRSRAIQQLLQFLLQENGKGHGHDGSPPSYSSLMAQVAAQSRSGNESVTAGHTTSMAGHSQTRASVLNYSGPPNPGQREVSRVGPAPTRRTDISVNESAPSRPLKAAGVAAAVEGAQSFRLQNSQTLTSDPQVSDNRLQDVEYCTDQADCVELVVALQRAVRQVHRAVAVVPPISQQADMGPKDDVPTTPDDSLPFKVDAVWTLAKDSESVEMGNNAASLPKEVSKELLGFHSVPQTQESIKPGNGSMIDTKSCEMPQTEKEPISESQSSKPSQAPICHMDLTVKSPEHQNNDLNVESCTDHATFDLSTVPVTDFTLEKLQHLVKSLEATSAEKEKESVTDVIKCTLDLYWGGDLRTLLNEVKAAVWIRTIAEMCINNKQDVVLQFLEPEKLKRLSSHLHILEETVTLPATEFRPWWLNVDGQPVDIEKVLAEPISDYDFTECKDTSRSVQLSKNDAEDLDVANQKNEIASDDDAEQNVISDPGLLEPEPSAEVLIPETTNCQNDIVIQEELITDLSETNVNPNKQEASNKQDVQQHHKQNNPLQRFMGSKEIPVGLIKSNNQAECEGYRYARKEANSSKLLIIDLTGPNAQTNTESPVPALHLSISDQLVEDDGSCGKSDTSSNDSLIMDVVVLSSDDVTTIFNDCDKQEKTIQVCQNEPKAVLCLSKPSSLPGKSEIQSHGSPSHFKFTCPHVTDIGCDADYLCPKCWDETPLLDVDLDESVFSPKEGGPNERSSPLKTGDESCSPQNGNQSEELTEPLSSDNNSVMQSVPFNLKVDGSEVTRAPTQPGDESCSPQNGNQSEELTEPLNLDNNRVMESVPFNLKVDGSEVTRAPTKPGGDGPSPQLGQLPVQEPLKPVCSIGKLIQLTQGVFLPKHLPPKKRILSKTGAKFASNLASPTLALIKPVSHKQHSGTHSFTSTSDSQDSRNKRKENNCSLKRILQKDKLSPQTEIHAYRTDVSVQHHLPRIKRIRPKNVMPQKPGGPACSTQSDAGQKTDLKVTFFLYGSQKRDRDFKHQCHDRQKSSTAPLYVSVSAADAGRSSTDVLSAKQKVCKQWFHSFVKKRKIPSKKWQKDCELELKNRIEIQKKVMKERALLKSLQDTNQLTTDVKRKGDDDAAQEPKKLKSTLTDDVE